MNNLFFIIISFISVSIAGAKRPPESLVNVNSTGLLGSTLCTDAELLGNYMCIMNDGTAPDRMYSNEVLMGGRNITNNTASAGYTSGSNNALRPDITVLARYTSKTIMSSLTTRASVYMDVFLCSEETCNNYVDIKFLQNGNLTGIGFMVGVIPYTTLALGSPLKDSLSSVSQEEIRKPQAEAARYVTSVSKTVRVGAEADVTDETGYAVLGTRVGFEAYSDYLLNNSSFGFASFSIKTGVCAHVLYPRNAWYQQNVISGLIKCSNATQTFAMMGVSNHNWCRVCDSATVNVINRHASCYPSDLLTCTEEMTYDNVNITTADNMTVRLYNLTYFNGFSDQGTYEHPWSKLLMEIIGEARSPVPAGCGFQDSEQAQCYNSANSCDITPYQCSPAKNETAVPGDGYDALLRSFENKWVASWQNPTFSMLGNERIAITYIQPEIDAAILWACQQASSAVVRSSAAFNPVSSAKGYVITFLINATAAVGAWLAYSEIATWVSRTLNRAESNAIGKFVAGVTTMVITVLPFVFIIISDFSINNSNSGDNTVYAQQAFDAPGYGKYKIVAIAQMIESVESSALPLACGLPLIFATAAIGFTAIIITEVVRKRGENQKMFPSNAQISSYCQHV